jgi:hypothetical protein
MNDLKEAEDISAAFFPSYEPPGMKLSKADKIYVGSIKTVIGNRSLFLVWVCER